MAVAFDAATKADDNTVTNISWPHTCTGADRLLLVGSLTGGIAALDVKYGGVKASLVRSQFHGSITLEVWKLVAPLTGSNTVEVIWDSPMDPQVFAVSYTGVNQTTPTRADTVATATAVSDPPDVSVTSLVNDLVVDFVAMTGAAVSWTPGASQTERIEAVAPTIDGAISDKAGAAGSTTMSYTDGNVASVQYIHMAVSLIPVGETPVVVPNYRYVTMSHARRMG